jgi:hypothetical protein
MSRRFLLIMQGASAPLMNTITHRLKASNLAYWHHMENTWLIAGVAEGVTAKNIADWLEQTPGFGETTYLILEIGSDARGWWGRNTQLAWDWMNSQWKP